MPAASATRTCLTDTWGRRLAPHEDVHHRNGIKTDNDLSNLELLTHGEHSRVTNGERTYRRGYRINRAALAKAGQA